jgi:hypothetical protein
MLDLTNLIGAVTATGTSRLPATRRCYSRTRPQVMFSPLHRFVSGLRDCLPSASALATGTATVVVPLRKQKVRNGRHED